MPYFNTSQLYAQLLKDKNEVVDERNAAEKVLPTRQIELRESGEASLGPDILRCIISCTSIKETLAEAKQSVTRRIDYILQTLRNNHVKESDYKSHKMLSTTDEGLYKMMSEVVIEFRDVKVYEKTINFLVEKLEKSIEISLPVLFHSPGKISDLRRQACLNAVRNCRSKALSITQFLNQTLGSPINITEEEMIEYTGHLRNENENKQSTSLQQQIENNTVTISVKIHAIFECKERTKNAVHK